MSCVSDADISIRLYENSLSISIIFWDLCVNFILWAWISNHNPHKSVGIDSLVPGDVYSVMPASGPQAQALFLRYHIFSGCNN